MEPLYDPKGRRIALAAHLGGGRSLQRRARRGRGELRDHAPAAEHLRVAHDRPLPPALARGCARSLAPDARLQHALPARLRPRRHLDLGRDRARAREGRKDAARPGARGLRQVRLGLARALRRHDHAAVPPARRLARLPARAVHDGPRVLRGGHALVRPPLRARLDLPRQPDRQLVPARPDRALRPRGRARGRGRHARLRALPARRGRWCTSRSRPCVRRRSSRTSPWPFTPTTTATATSSARKSSCRTSSGACR